MNEDKQIIALIGQCSNALDELRELDPKNSLLRFDTSRAILEEWQQVTTDFYRRYAGVEIPFVNLSGEEYLRAWESFQGEIESALSIAWAMATSSTKGQ